MPSLWSRSGGARLGGERYLGATWNQKRVRIQERNNFETVHITNEEAGLGDNFVSWEHARAF